MSEILKIDHLGIAVQNLEEAIKLYDNLGLQLEHRETVASQKVNTATLPVGESKIELLEPTDESSSVAKFIASKGGGIHHLAVQVDNLDEKLAELKNMGVRMIDESPRPGINGTRVAFVHPQSTKGVLLELVEHQRS